MKLIGRIRPGHSTKKKMPVQSAPRAEGPRKQRERYEWTPEKVGRLEEMKEQGLSYEEIAKKLNEEFPGDRVASYNTVSSRLTGDVYKRRPELSKMNKWDSERAARLVELLEEGVPRKEIAGILNREFEGFNVTRKAVIHRIAKYVYPRRGDLRTDTAKTYTWTPEKEERLVELKEQGISAREIAQILNNEYPEGDCTEGIVEGKLWREVYSKRPELMRAYKWTKEKDKRLEELTEAGLTSKQIAGRLNEEFPEGTSANYDIVRYRQENELFQRRPELKKRKRRYQWTPAKVSRVEELLEEGLSYREIAERLNEEFGGAKATKTILNTKISRDIYKRRPELKREQRLNDPNGVNEVISALREFKK